MAVRCSGGGVWFVSSGGIAMGVYEVDAAAVRSGFEIAGGSVVGGCGFDEVAAVARCGVDDVEEAEDYEGDADDDAEDFEGGVDWGYLVGAGIEGHDCVWRWDGEGLASWSALSQWRKGERMEYRKDQLSL